VGKKKALSYLIQLEPRDTDINKGFGVVLLVDLFRLVEREVRGQAVPGDPARNATLVLSAFPMFVPILSW
jgi:hypothetical protein